MHKSTLHMAFLLSRLLAYNLGEANAKMGPRDLWQVFDLFRRNTQQWDARKEALTMEQFRAAYFNPEGRPWTLKPDLSQDELIQILADIVCLTIKLVNTEAQINDSHAALYEGLKDILEADTKVPYQEEAFHQWMESMQPTFAPLPGEHPFEEYQRAYNLLRSVNHQMSQSKLKSARSRDGSYNWDNFFTRGELNAIYTPKFMLREQPDARRNLSPEEIAQLRDPIDYQFVFLADHPSDADGSRRRALQAHRESRGQLVYDFEQSPPSYRVNLRDFDSTDSFLDRLNCTLKLEALHVNFSFVYLTHAAVGSHGEVDTTFITQPAIRKVVHHSLVPGSQDDWEEIVEFAENGPAEQWFVFCLRPVDPNNIYAWTQYKTINPSDGSFEVLEPSPVKVSADASALEEENVPDTQAKRLADDLSPYQCPSVTNEMMADLHREVFNVDLRDPRKLVVWQRKTISRLMNRTDLPAVVSDSTFFKDVGNQVGALKNALAAELAEQEVDGDGDDFGSSARNVLHGSENTLGLPIADCVTYLRAEPVGLHRQKENLPTYKSPFFPDLRVQLLETQITGIVYMLGRQTGPLPRLGNDETAEQTAARERLSAQSLRTNGTLLGDYMGLGKTITTLCVLSLLVQLSGNIKDEAPQPILDSRPMLLLVPSVTIAKQWEETIVQNFPALEPVLAFGRTDSRGYQGRGGTLSREWFESPQQHGPKYLRKPKSKQSRNKVIIATIASFSRRSVKYVKSTNAVGKTITRPVSRLTSKGFGFSMVVVDEAHKLKNTHTLYFKSVRLLKYSRIILVTATPSLNNVSDILALCDILWKAAASALNQNPQAAASVKGDFKKLRDLTRLDAEPLSSPLWLAGLRPRMLEQTLKFTLQKGYDTMKLMTFTKYFEIPIVLRRGPNSVLYRDEAKTQPVTLDGLMPDVESYTVNVQFHPEYETHYQRYHAFYLFQYCEDLKKCAGRSAPNETPRKSWKQDSQQVAHPPVNINQWTRKMSIATGSPNLSRLSAVLGHIGKDIDAKTVQQMRQAGWTLFTMFRYFRPVGARLCRTAYGWIAEASRATPALKFILSMAQRTVLGNPSSKILIIEDSPIMAYYYELILRFMMFRCETLHAGLKEWERAQLTAQFRSKDPDSPQILIQTYQVGSQGVNLQGACHTVIVTSPAPNLATEEQAVARVIRVSQTHTVTVFRINVPHSHHEYVRSRQLMKIVPDVAGRVGEEQQKTLAMLLNRYQSEITGTWESEIAYIVCGAPSRLILLGGNLDVHAVDALQKYREAQKTGDYSLCKSSRPYPLDPPKFFGPSIPAKRKAPVEGNPEEGQREVMVRENGLLGSVVTRSQIRDFFYKLDLQTRMEFNDELAMIMYKLTFPRDFTWTQEHLRHPGVLEYAIHLVYRVHVGSADRMIVRQSPGLEYAQVGASFKQLITKFSSGVDWAKAPGFAEDMRETLQPTVGLRGIDGTVNADAALENESVLADDDGDRMSMLDDDEEYMETDDDEEGDVSDSSLGDASDED
ncbi:hypothetical protein F4780DRAFT_719220 [Xylariomycetidae sp. FL0641]|nr:hypothetical protein F4780DRAFT_719220 [Xylariomycetidae sp. FL0641]